MSKINKYYGLSISLVGLAILCLATVTVYADDPPRVHISANDSAISSNHDGVIDIIHRRPAPLNEMRRVGGSVRSFRVPPGIFHSPAEFWNLYGQTLGLGTDDRMVPLQVAPGMQPIGHCFTHRYRQYHRDVAMLHGFYNLVTCSNRVVAGLGTIFPSLSVDTVPRLTPKDALQAAIRVVTRGQSGAQAKPSASIQLAIYVPDGDHATASRLVYRIPMVLRDPLNSFEVLIDADTGALVRKRTLSRQIWSEISTSGQSVYDSNVNFLAQQNENGAIRLVTDTLFDIQTRNAKNQSTLANSEDIVINSPTIPDQIKLHGISAHWAAQGAWQYFLDKHAWHGIDGSGEHLRVFLNLQYPASANMPSWGAFDAGWFGPDPFVGPEPDGTQLQWQIIALGAGGTDSDGNEYEPLLHPEILAHEMTHAIQYYQVGFLQGFEYNAASPDAGGLSESFADIFGVLAESYIRQISVDYTIGEQWGYVDRQRTLYNPSLSKPIQPMKYEDSVWNAAIAPNESDLHFYSGPHSRWFFLLAEGEPQVVHGIGPDKAGEIFFHAMTQLLFPTAQYDDALIAELLAAEFLFGPHTQPVASLQDAAFAAGVGPGYVNNLFYQPADQAQDVPPWPVVLAWEALGDEVQWQIEISRSENFNSDIIARETESIDPGSIVQLISLPSNKRPNLRADSVYHWRVRGRSSNSAVWQEWRVPVSFKTASQQVTPVSPWIEDKKEYHPWELPFNWQPVEQAERYELDVFQGPHNALVNWHDPLLTPNPLSGTTITLDVRVNREHTWRIRAIGPEGDFGPNYGTWTEVPFVTELPHVTLLEPINGDPRYPWPTELKWEKVIGADHYLIDLTDCDGVFMSTNPNSPFPCAVLNPNLNYEQQKLGPEVTQFDLNVKPEWLHDEVHYWWQVQVIGPPPWHDEGGLSKPKGHWQVDGYDTLPKQLYPEFSVINTECIDLGENITFQWASVPNAVGYRLRITKMWAESGVQPSNDPILKHGQKIFAQTFAAEPLSTQSQTVQNAGTGPMAGPRHLGYWWHVESQGPDAYSGLRDINGSYYFVESDTPVPNLEDGHQFGQHDKVVLPWKSDHAPFADYILYVYQGIGCLNGNLFSKDFISGNSPGKSGADVSSNDLEDGETYSWSVTPAWHMKHTQCFQGKLESACVSFQAPAPICGNGLKEDGEQCDDGNLQDGDGCSSQCKEVLACGQQQGAAGGINIAYEDQPLDLGGNKGRVWITAQTYTIPDRLVFRHDNEIIHEIDCYGTEGQEVVSRYIQGGSSNLYITVEPGCDDNVQSMGTKWAYTVSCVDDTSPLPDHTPE